MTTRIDSASRLIAASPEAVYRAFAEPDAMERWIPPANMRGKILHFDFREGGSYSMRLTYAEPQPVHGKTSEDSDEVEMRIAKLEAGRRIEQEVMFQSDDCAFSGVMHMIWIFESKGDSTLVTVQAENVPPGIRPEDHETGMKSSLENLAAFVESR